jgi:precorrin-3B C17-methyltransferase
VSGSVRVVGIGPGPAACITPEVSQALTMANVIVGYHKYVARLDLHSGQSVYTSGNGDEIERARLALDLALKGERVAVVSGGDPGVFAMASAIFEAMEHGPLSWRSIDVTVLPGVTAMLAAAARLGAPLGNDFCAINLSDNLKPWAVIENRLRLAAKADFVIAIYNPASTARPMQIEKGFAVLRKYRRPNTLVVFARDIGSAEEDLVFTTLDRTEEIVPDMRTLILVGATSTSWIERPDGRRWIYSPRSLKEVS